VTILHVTTMEDSSELIADEQFLRWKMRLRCGNPWQTLILKGWIKAFLINLDSRLSSERMTENWMN
jgi:hypothetical protein